MATDVSLNRLRTRRRHPETRNEKLLAAIAAADAPDRQAEHRTLLERIFRRERPSTALIATLHWVDGLSLPEVAEVVGLSVSGVRKRLRGLKQRAGEALGGLE